LIKRKKIKLENEYIILSYMITNKKVITCAYDRYKSNELKTKYFSAFYRMIFRWLIKYFSDYRKEPQKTITEIFNRQSKKISYEEKELISEYLTKLSDEYENTIDQNVDPDFIINEMIPDFIREKGIKTHLEQVQNDMDAGERKIDVQINRLRRKIEVDPSDPKWLQTVRGIGYKLCID